MATTALSPEAILTSLTRVLHPQYGVGVVNLGTIYGIELDGDKATITMVLTSDSTKDEIEQLITEGLYRRHPDLAPVTFVISNDPLWR